MSVELLLRKVGKVWPQLSFSKRNRYSMPDLVYRSLPGFRSKSLNVVSFASHHLGFQNASYGDWLTRELVSPEKCRARDFRLIVVCGRSE